MKSFFENKMNKGNPFITNKNEKGDEEKTMANENQENEENITEEEITEAADEAEKAGASEILESDEIKADKLKQDLESLNNQYLRLAADFENYRKRQMQEREALIKYGAEDCIKKVIEVADNFDRAIDMVEKIDNLDKMKETFYILNKQLNESLSKLGLEQIKSIGEKFDPNLHEAVMQTQTEDYPEDTIINELQKGYKFGNKVIRPSMVSVAVK
ncbi:MAG: nucleotide exchange factor GrpE [Candidatus Gastranaerophilales bacterium]|nr:nucleotide exchange factor GrpE [Candidatus Gastranaerophilales bacterium]